MGSLFADTASAEKPRTSFGLDMLSDWLPYRVYDPASRLYVNARSKGFVLGVTPLIGADERTGEILGAFFSEGLPAGACLQILHLASPRISRIVAPWFAPRYEQGGVYEAIARHRARKLYSMVWTSGASDAPFHARAHQVVISLGVPASRSISNEELTHAREGLIAMLKSLNLGVAEYEPHDLIALLDDLAVGEEGRAGPELDGLLARINTGLRRGPAGALGRGRFSARHLGDRARGVGGLCRCRP